MIGWGYKIVNEDLANWFVPTLLDATTIALGTPNAGYFDFPIIAAGDAAATAFDATSGSGLYGLELSPFAVAGQTQSGTFALSGEWWSGDPFGSGTFLREAPAVQAAFLVTVINADSPGAIPEPGSGLLVVTALGLLFLSRKGPRQELG